MARTIYEPINAKHSEEAHLAARRLLYPLIFGVPEEDLDYESVATQNTERERILDCEMAVDRIIKVHTHYLAAPLMFTIQERFRRRYAKKVDKHGQTRIVDYTTFGDITITEWNHASKLPSELFKINAGYFVYAYYDKATDTFFKPIMVNVADLLFDIILGRLPYPSKPNQNQKEQSFVGFPYKKVKALHLAVFYEDRVPLGKACVADRVTKLVTPPLAPALPTQGGLWLT